MLCGLEKCATRGETCRLEYFREIYSILETSISASISSILLWMLLVVASMVSIARCWSLLKSMREASGIQSLWLQAEGTKIDVNFSCLILPPLPLLRAKAFESLQMEFSPGLPIRVKIYGVEKLPTPIPTPTRQPWFSPSNQAQQFCIFPAAHQQISVSEFACPHHVHPPKLSKSLMKSCCWVPTSRPPQITTKTAFAQRINGLWSHRPLCTFSPREFWFFSYLKVDITNR